MTGTDLIAQERRRQIDREGWTAAHDDQHTKGELVWAAVSYALHGSGGFLPGWWPWGPDTWKPADQVRSLTKAGALIAAEIDRLLRLNPPTVPSGPPNPPRPDRPREVS